MARTTTAPRTRKPARAPARRGAPRSASRSAARSARSPGRSRSRRPAARGGAGVAGPEQGLQEFLDRFAAALTAGDGDGAAACFEYPALMVMAQVGGHGGSQVLQDRATVAGFFAKAPGQYHAKGIHETFPDIEDVQHLGGDLALARVRFPYIDADGNDLGDGETSAYVLRRSGRGFAICAAITLGADGDRAGTAVEPAD